MDQNRTRALFALTAAGLVWGLTVPLSKVALGWLDPLWLGVARFAIAAPILALVARRTLRRAVAPRVMAWGVLFYGAMVAVQNLGIERTSVSHAALIVGAVPVLVALTALALGRASAGVSAWIGFIAALLGVGLVAGSGGDSSLVGDLLMLASGALSALFIVAQPRLLAGRDPVAVTAVQMAAGAVAVTPIAFIFEGVGAAAPTATQAWALGGLILVGSVLPFALYAYGQARVSVEVAGAFVNLEPLVGAAAGALVFQDPFGPAQTLGAAAILVGVVLSALGQGSREPCPA